MFRKLGRTPALDGVRAIAITAVILLHAAGAYFPGGAIGVDVFFVLSAFLITSLIMQEVRSNSHLFGFANFYWRRFFRLAPALALWLVAVAAPTAIVAGQTREILGSSLISVFYVGDFAIAHNWVPIADAYTHVWSLAIEEQFYLVWPAVLVLLLLRRPDTRRRVLIWALFGSAVIQTGAAHLSANAYFLPWGHLVPIASGCLAAELCCYGIPRLVADWARRASLALLVMVAIGLFTVGSSRITSRPLYSLAVVAIALAVAMLVIHAREITQGPAIWLLTVPFVVWMGRRSYGLYLYHRTLAQLIPGLIPGVRLAIAGPLVVLLSLVVAELSYRYVELPAMRAGHAWLRSRNGATPRE